MLENLAVSIASFFYEVSDKVDGPLYPEQTSKIAELLEAYKNRHNPRKVSIEDFKELREIEQPDNYTTKVHVSDYYLFDKEKNEHFLIELKIGGDLDNKKARSEKEAIFELLELEREALMEKDNLITGFNIGINDGSDAGQTVMHCHVHLIPRRSGDMNNPRGGVRGVIPEKQSY